MIPEETRMVVRLRQAFPYGLRTASAQSQTRTSAPR